MKIEKSTTPVKKIILTIATIILVSALAFGVWYFLVGKDASDSEIRDTPTTDSPETKKINQAQKKDFIENTDLPDQEQPAETKASADISLDASQDGGVVIIKTKLPGFSDGTCDLTITANGKTFKDSANILYQPSFSTCRGFSVPVSELGSGAWNIELAASDQNTNGKTTASIEVR